MHFDDRYFYNFICLIWDFGFKKRKDETCVWAFQCISKAMGFGNSIKVHMVSIIESCLGFSYMSTVCLKW